MGGMFGGDDPGEAEREEERGELEKAKAERTEKARQLMLKRLQMLRRRRGGVGGGGGAPIQPDQQGQQDLLGG